MKMNTLTRLTMTGAMALAVAACNASGGDDDVGGGGIGGGTVVSSGIIQNVELPDANARTALPTLAQTIISNFETANALAPTSVLPSGSATYSGSSAFAVLDGPDGDVLNAVTGDANLSVNFDAPQVSGTFGNFTVADVTGASTVNVNSGSINLAPTTISGSAFNGTVSGTINATVTEGGSTDTLDFTVDGTLNGGFGEADAGTAVGSIEGTLTGGGATDPLEGIFVTTKD